MSRSVSIRRTRGFSPSLSNPAGLMPLESRLLSAAFYQTNPGRALIATIGTRTNVDADLQTQTLIGLDGSGVAASSTGTDDQGVSQHQEGLSTLNVAGPTTPTSATQVVLIYATQTNSGTLTAPDTATINTGDATRNNLQTPAGNPLTYAIANADGSTIGTTNVLIHFEASYHPTIADGFTNSAISFNFGCNGFAVTINAGFYTIAGPSGTDSGTYLDMNGQQAAFSIASNVSVAVPAGTAFAIGFQSELDAGITYPIVQLGVYQTSSDTASFGFSFSATVQP